LQYQKFPFPVYNPSPKCKLSIHSNILYGEELKSVQDELKVGSSPDTKIIKNPWTDYFHFQKGVFGDVKVESRGKRLSNNIAKRKRISYKPTVPFVDCPVDSVEERYNSQKKQSEVDDQYVIKGRSRPLTYKVPTITLNPNLRQIKREVPKKEKRPFYHYSQKFSKEIPIPTNHFKPSKPLQNENQYTFTNESRIVFENLLKEQRDVKWSLNFEAQERRNVDYKINRMFEDLARIDPERKYGALFECYTNYLQKR
jgi:hypothetical protein